jgi:hypothetical protein
VALAPNLDSILCREILVLPQLDQLIEAVGTATEWMRGLARSAAVR